MLIGIKKILHKLSVCLLKIHLYLDRKLKKETLYRPYTLDYHPLESNIKIIHFNGNFTVGGSTQLIVDIIERTSDQFVHKIIVPSFPEPLPYQPVLIKKFSFEHMIDLYKYLKDENPTLVHIHYWIRIKDRYHSDLLWYQAVFKICEELKLKIIQNINVPTNPFINSAIIHNVFVSRYVEENFNNSSVPASVIYPGSNFNHFNNDEMLTSNSIGMVYRLDQDKLNAQAIEVFINVVKFNPTIRCYIVGGGFFFDYYNKRVKEEKLTSNFVFTGMVSYNLLPDYYKKIDILVAPVHDESFGQVTPFAMNMGLCVVGYDIGALSEILGSKDTLVQYGDIKALTEKILGLIYDPEKRKKIGEQNKKRAYQNFSVESMIQHYKNLYEDYIGK